VGDKIMTTDKSKCELRSQLRKKDYAVKQFGGKCQICGYSKCLAALEFHHVDPSDKKFSPSSIIRRLKWEDALEELQKCILICANCHREFHYSNESLDFKKFLRTWVKKNCTLCSTEYLTYRIEQKFCSNECSSMSQRKVSRPTHSELLDLLNKGFSKRKISKMFGVSDVAVGKWIKRGSVD
jgi:hypothetical protein